MTTHAPVQASPLPQVATPEFDLDTRLALIGAAMNVRLDQAAVAFEVNTAHIPAGVRPEITAPLPLPAPYRTPLAVALHEARILIGADGWTRGACRDEQGARCPVGAIRATAASRHHADDACTLLLETIQRDFRDADTVPSWNDAQAGPRFPLLYLGKAADLAHARNL